jgi:Secretion system C-terminal sorting domain
MKTITFKVSFIVLALSFSFSHSSFAQDNTNNHFTRGDGITEINLSCQWYADPNYITGNGIFQSIDNGKTITINNHDLDNNYTAVPSSLQVKNSYTIIPNPSSGKSKLKVQLKPQDSQLILFDLTGRLQFKICVDPGQDNAEIDVVNLNKGIYILKVLAGETVVGIEKMVIN